MPATGDALRAHAKAGGIDTAYVAHFDGTQLQRIDEIRTSGGNAQGTYEFNGARLIHYQGTALLDSTTVDVTFDMQGATREAGGANQDEIAAIRNRASLLRSLALTRRSTQSHGG